MGKVLFGLSVSLDEFIADTNDDVSLVFAWMGSPWEHFNEVVGDALGECSAGIMGHRSLASRFTVSRGGSLPDGTAPDWPVMVLQSHARASVKKGKTHSRWQKD